MAKGGSLYTMKDEVESSDFSWGQENQWAFIRDSQEEREDGENSYLVGSDLFSQVSRGLMKAKGLKQWGNYLAGL